MRRFVIGIVVFVGAALAMGVGLTGLNPNVTQQPLIIARTVTADDVPLTGSTRTWNSIKETFLPVRLEFPDLYLSFLAYGDGSGGGNPEGGTFSFTVYACHQFGSAMQVCSGTAVIGALQASHNPQTGGAYSDATQYKWAEGPFTVAAAANCWRTPVGLSGTSDDMGAINLITYRIFGYWVEITNMVGITEIYVVESGCEAMT